MRTLLRTLLVSLCALCACTSLTVLDYADPMEPLPEQTLSYRWNHSTLTGTTSLVANRLRLTTTVPLLTRDCRLTLTELSACRDLDLDGLNDWWERIALHKLRPFLRMHPDEPLFLDVNGRAVATGRVMRAASGHIRLFLALLFSRDYGRCGATGHRGDVERVVLDLEQLNENTVELVGAYTASHEGSQFDGSVLLEQTEITDLEFVQDDITDMPRWVVYSSLGKHATYPSVDVCQSNTSLPCFRDDCARNSEAPRVLLLDVYNVGEPDSSGFGSEGGTGESMERPHTAPPPVGDIWKDIDYCGGSPDSAGESAGGACTGGIRGDLVEDPFADPFG